MITRRHMIKERIERYRARMRAKGFRQINLWVPDTRSPAFARECRKQSLLAARSDDRTLQVADLKTWHRRWLGNVYVWAGEERSVNLSKGDFHFAVATQIPRLLAEFERNSLARFTPCHSTGDEALAEAIAVTHVEFILIHPFREGNGRLSRLLADVMAVQAARDPLDYSGWDADKPAYFSAIQQGLAGNYQPMKRLAAKALGR